MIQVRDINNFNEYLDKLLEQNESDDLEFKSGSGGFPGSFWDTYSAFANSEGGTIVLGVQEKKGSFYIDNLTEQQVEKYRKDFWNNVNNRSTVSANLMQSKDVVVGNYKGYAFMLFFVPRAPRELRPVFRTNDPYKGTFKRNYEGDYKCSEKEVQRMFADADDTRPADSRILKGYSLDDLDKEALNRYRQLFSLSSPDHPWLALDNKELLRMLGGQWTWKRDEVLSSTRKSQHSQGRYYESGNLGYEKWQPRWSKSGNLGYEKWQPRWSKSGNLGCEKWQPRWSKSGNLAEEEIITR